MEWTDLTSQNHNFVFHHQFATRDFQRRTSHTAHEPISVSRVPIHDQSTSKNTDLRPFSVSKFPILFATPTKNKPTANKQINRLRAEPSKNDHNNPFLLILRTCLEHGKHVLVEYPMVLTDQAGKELFKLAEEKGEYSESQRVCISARTAPVSDLPK